MKSKRVGHGSLKLAVCSALLSATTIAAAGPREASAADLARLSSFVGESASVAGVLPSKVDPSLAGTSGRHVVLARLAGAPVAGSGGAVTRESVAAEQAAFISRILAIAPSMEVLASMQLAQNAVVLSVDAQDLVKLARDTSITRVVPVANYSLDLSETVPYIGGETAHELGAKGKGVRIAVIDSGVDYTHAALSGPGTQAAYEAAWAPIPPAGAPAIPVLTSGGYLVTDDPATSADDGLFPSAKVIGGYDFVGEDWPNTDLAPDPDPIPAPDATTNGGHGTHVADIIAGKLGVAPEARLYALKACSQPATSCSGIALMQSMEFALDPNGDGNLRDRVDIINMSLGSVYGQPFDDDLSAAVDAASREGVLTVASAGNSADKQFITGSPGAATTALSVAQTAVPSATLSLFTVLSPAAGDRAAIFQPWSVPLAGVIEGPVVYPPAGGKRLGCADAAGNTPYSAGELAGQIVLVDRGTCSFSLKIANIAAAGGILGIIGLITPDAPFGGAFGGGVQTIPGYMISQADANLLRTGTGAVRFDPANVLPLAGSLASTSSRGPRFDDSKVKPEIGAPGASVSAMSGSFTGTAAFGGTSGAAPMVTGAAALIMSARPKLNNFDVKQLLVNTGETDVWQPSSLGSVLPDQLAPITRIGGGEVRVDRALLSPTIVSDFTDYANSAHGAVSFGYLDASKTSHTFTRKLEVENKSNTTESYSVSASLRYQDDKDTGAVTMSVSPTHVTVPGRGKSWVTVKLSVDGSKLRNNLMSAGDAGNAIGPLTANEYDGYITLQGDDHKVSMPWHILPRKSADVSAKLAGGHLPIDPSTGAGTVKLENKGVGAANIYAYSLLATGTDRPRGDRGEQAPNPDIRAIGLNTLGVPAGVCHATEANFVWEFVFNMFERSASPAGIWHEVDIDTTGDGLADFWVFNIDNSGFTTLTDGRQRVVVVNAATGAGSLRFFVEHATNSSNVILRVCGNDLGLTLADAGRPMNAEFYAQSWYFGQTAPILGPYSISPGGEEFFGAVAGDQLAAKAKGDLLVQQYPPLPGLSPQQGLLLINNSDWGAASGNRGGATFATEALILPR
jgi:subtilisin family serine protease